MPSRTAAALLVLASIGAACGNKPDECKALIAAVERADRSRLEGELGTPELGKKYYDGMLEEKRALGELSLSMSELATLRDAAVKNQESFIFAQREIEKSRVPTELDAAMEKRGDVMRAHDEYTAELGTQCGTQVVLATKAKPAAPVPIATESPPTPPASASAAVTADATSDAWIPFRHPTVPFEAQFFRAPEVGERKGPSSVTHAAIADDGERRMFSAAHITFPSPPTYDCKTLLDTHVQGTQDRFRCRRTEESRSPVGGSPALEAKLECADGGTMIKRVSCVSEPAEQRVVLFDVQALYLRDWDAAVARKFIDSAKLLPR